MWYCIHNQDIFALGENFFLYDSPSTTRRTTPSLDFFVKTLLSAIPDSFFQGFILIYSPFFVSESPGNFIIVLSMFFLHQVAKHYEGLFNYVFTDDRNYVWYVEQPVGTIATAHPIPHRPNFITGNPNVVFSERLGYDGLNLFIKRFDVNYFHIDYFEPGFNLFLDNEGRPIKIIELSEFEAPPFFRT
jgi:hypothetical protein